MHVWGYTNPSKSFFPKSMQDPFFFLILCILRSLLRFMDLLSMGEAKQSIDTDVSIPRLRCQSIVSSNLFGKISILQYFPTLVPQQLTFSGSVAHRLCVPDLFDGRWYKTYTQKGSQQSKKHRKLACLWEDKYNLFYIFSEVGRENETKG